MLEKKYKCVYVIQNKCANVLKIGITSDINQRLNTLMAHSGCEMIVLYSTIPVSNSELIEKTMHEFFKEYRFYGEWFKCESNIVVNKLKQYENEFGLPDDVALKYLSGISVSVLANENNVTRQAIINRLKKARLIREKEVKNQNKNPYTFKELFPKSIPNNFTKVDKNIYYNGFIYKFKLYYKGSFIEKYFETLDCVKAYIDYFNINKN